MTGQDEGQLRSGDRKPPFLVDYAVDGRRFSFMLLGPTSWAEAEAHLAAIAATGRVEGSDAVEIEAFPEARALEVWAELADALLAALMNAGRADQMALTAAAAMAVSMVTAGLNRGEAAVAAAAMLDEVYAMEKPRA
jgi:hypothetical protein